MFNIGDRVKVRLTPDDEYELGVIVDITDKPIVVDYVFYGVKLDDSGVFYFSEHSLELVSTYSCQGLIEWLRM